MLKDDGLLIIGESMILSLFIPKKKVQIFKIIYKCLKWYLACDLQ